MSKFTDFIQPKLKYNGYKTIQHTDNDLFVRTPDDKPVWVCYLNAELPPEQIRRAFEFKGHVLFVVDDKLIPQDIKDRKSTPMWLRVLHGLYMGRIYTWNGRFLYGLHFDYEAGVINESGAIQFDELLLTEEKTWLKGWTEVYRIARFYDRAWWTGGDADFGGRYEQARQYDQKWQRENARQEQYWKGQKQTYDNPFAQQESSGRDFGREFRACNSLLEIKALYRNLAREFHPDLNPGKDTTAIMQQINTAYDRAKLVYA